MYVNRYRLPVAKNKGLGRLHGRTLGMYRTKGLGDDSVITVNQNDIPPDPLLIAQEISQSNVDPTQAQLTQALNQEVAADNKTITTPALPYYSYLATQYVNKNTNVAGTPVSNGLIVGGAALLLGIAVISGGKRRR